MNKRTRILTLVLCLGIGLIATTVWAQTGGFRLARSAFSQTGTGAAPLTSASFQMRASVGQPAPVGSASSDSFGLAAGYWSPTVSAEWQHRIYLPLVLSSVEGLVVRDFGP